MAHGICSFHRRASARVFTTLGFARFHSVGTGTRGSVRVFGSYKEGTFGFLPEGGWHDTSRVRPGGAAPGRAGEGSVRCVTSGWLLHLSEPHVLPPRKERFGSGQGHSVPLGASTAMSTRHGRVGRAPSPHPGSSQPRGSITKDRLQPEITTCFFPAPGPPRTFWGARQRGKMLLV